MEEIEYLIGRQVDGLLIVPTSSDAAHFQARQLARIPVVAFDQPIHGAGFDSILVKNRKGAAEAVEHLIQHGHKRIGCIGVNRHLYSIRRRIEGYRSAMKKARLQEMLEIVEPDEASVDRQVGLWLGQKNPPTAIFSLNELTSIGVVESLSARGIQVPERIAFISFDEIQLAKYLDPPVTSVVQPGLEIGATVGSTLMERIETKNEAPGKRILLDTQLIIRSSCGCHDSQQSV